MLNLLKLRLEESVKRLDSLVDNLSPGSDEDRMVEDEEAIKRNLLLMVDAQKEMFDLEMKNFNSQTLSNNLDGSDLACSTIQKQIESISDRNLTSALLSMEKATMQCDNAIVEKIEASAQGIEAIIPTLDEKLSNRKAEMSASHDCSTLLSSTVEKNYCTMRDGYLELLRKVFAEASIQWKSLLRLQKPNTKWHLEKLRQVIENAKDSPEHLERREDIHAEAQRQLDHFCSESFKKIEGSSMYEEKEYYLEQIDLFKRGVFEHKQRVVQDRERVLNNAIVQMDELSMNSVEELNQHLFELQEFENKLHFYERRLTQLLVVAFRRELKMDRLGKTPAAVPTSPFQATASSTAETVALSSGSGGTVSYSADSAQIVELGRRTIEDLRAPFRMGTVLRSLAHSCELPPEKTEELLQSVLFADLQESGSFS